MRKLILTTLLLVPFIVSCHQRPTSVLDQIAPGSQITVTTKAGATVAGLLTETRPDVVVIQPAGGVPATIRRADIATVTVPATAGGPGGPGATGSTPPPQPAPPDQGAAGSASPVPSPTPEPPAAAAGTALAPRAMGGVPAAAAPPKPAAPAWREVTLPEGTLLAVRLDEAVGSDTSRVEDGVSATLLEDVEVGGATVLPAGSRVAGTVTHAKRSGKVKGVAELAVRFHSVTPKGSDARYEIQTGQVARRAATSRKKDALEIGAPAAGGAIIGGLLGGKKGAVIGGSVGGGAGTAVVLNQRGKEVRLPRGSHLSLRLLEPVTVRVPA